MRGASERRARRRAGRRGGAGRMEHDSTYAGMPLARKSTSVNGGVPAPIRRGSLPVAEPGLLVTGHRPLYSEVALMPPGRPRSTGCKGVGAGNARNCERFQNLEETIVR